MQFRCNGCGETQFASELFHNACSYCHSDSLSERPYREEVANEKADRVRDAELVS